MFIGCRVSGISPKLETQSPKNIPDPDPKGMPDYGTPLMLGLQNVTAAIPDFAWTVPSLWVMK